MAKLIKHTVVYTSYYLSNFPQLLPLLFSSLPPSLPPSLPLSLPPSLPPSFPFSPPSLSPSFPLSPLPFYSFSPPSPLNYPFDLSLALSLLHPPSLLYFFPSLHLSYLFFSPSLFLSLSISRFFSLPFFPLSFRSLLSFFSHSPFLPFFLILSLLALPLHFPFSLLLFFLHSSSFFHCHTHLITPTSPS